MRGSAVDHELRCPVMGSKGARCRITPELEDGVQSMSEFDDLYGGKYLNATELNGSVIATIEKIEEETFAKEGQKARPKKVLLFKGASKGVVLNKTNATVLAAAFGTDFTRWIGKPVKVAPESTSFGGKIVPAIRLYPAPAPKIETKPQPKPEPKSEPKPEPRSEPNSDEDLNDAIPW
jgi:hypothetical protein